MYFQITFDSGTIKAWFGRVWASILCFGINHLVTKRKKRIILLWLMRKDLKYSRQSRIQNRLRINRMLNI